MLMSTNVQSFLEDFVEATTDIADPRVKGRSIHPLENVLFIALCATICDGDGWQDMEDWGQANQHWLNDLLELPPTTPIPSADTFARLFRRISQPAFEQFFYSWVARAMEVALQQSLTQQQSGTIAIDGKSLRGAADRPQLVSAYATDERLILSQREVPQKRNELAAMHELIEHLTLDGEVITIDAMGCNPAIAHNILQHNADYVLALKENQPELCQQVRDRFQADVQRPEYEQVEKAHGRIETRRYRLLTDLRYVDAAATWPQAAMAIEVYRKREWPNRAPQEQTQYYLCSRQAELETAASWIRAHWGIENRVHWVLDVVFQEDHTLISAGNAPANLSRLKRLVLNLLKKVPSEKKLSMRRKRRWAARDNDYLLTVLGCVF